MDKKAKTYLIIAAVVLLFLVGFGIYFYRKGKRQTTIAPVVKDIPGSSASDNNPAGTSNAEIKMISENLYNEMKGTNITGHAPQPYAALLALSDTDFEKVYNEFNQDHQKESAETLKGWINDQWSGWHTDFDGLKTAIMARFAKLNLV